MTLEAIQNDGNVVVAQPDEGRQDGHVGPPANQPSLLHRSLHVTPSRVTSASGNYIHLSTGQRILDATGGAAVACLGHGNRRVGAAVAAQMQSFSYAHTLVFTSAAAEELADLLVESTGGAMSKAFVVSSGSEAMEAALKLARQYFMEMSPAQPRRANFIARRQSYHGNTLGALSASGHVARRALFEPTLLRNVSHVSACNVYRGLRAGETEADYVARLAQELDDEFARLGPDNVCAFVAEPVVGAALGCVTSPPGYFQAMKRVCDKHGALVILDEVMSGMGRTGTLHAWQAQEVGIVPDIQTIGKGLGGGYAPVAGLLINRKVVDVLDNGTGAFSHGQTYQGHPVACAAALEVQKIIREENLVENAMVMGQLLGSLLTERLKDHPHVGDVRGRGLFWGIEFVRDKPTKTPFDPSAAIAMGVHEMALRPPFSISLYPGTGSANGKSGDHILLAPAYNVSESEVRHIVDLAVGAIEAFFSQQGG